MNAVAVWAFLKAMLPWKKIMAWVLGLVAAGLAIVAGISNTDLKAQFCANDVVSLPTAAAPAVAAPVAPAK